MKPKENIHRYKDTAKRWNIFCKICVKLCHFFYKKTKLDERRIKQYDLKTISRGRNLGQQNDFFFAKYDGIYAHFCFV